VIRRPVSRARLRLEIARRLPFESEIIVCQAREILRALLHDHYAGHPVRPDLVRFVSVLSRLPRSTPRLPLTVPARGPWLVKVLARDRRLLFGLYRRHMKVIGCLGTLDGLFGVPVTTRSWSTIAAIGAVLGRRAP
jgi:hypothetical protein